MSKNVLEKTSKQAKDCHTEAATCHVYSLFLVSSFKIFTSLILFCFENVCKIYCIMRVLSWQCYTIHLVFLSLFFLKLLGNLYKRYKSNVYLALRPGDCWQPQEYLYLLQEFHFTHTFEINETFPKFEYSLLVMVNCFVGSFTDWFFPYLHQKFDKYITISNSEKVGGLLLTAGILDSRK